ncbi:lysophospholipid acyltransferase family protein [Cohnella thermotolerans]|jgi:1-acyl-sn-glycerol-3-phosphate acyltransferase|uniref:lysophospholipid acyltransferase family protein n=1 Tax=Cohnella thermotolerans TaxID=329858 RepID=UPI00040FC1EB|nr:lysophospholipid acyltransferase family protein [Cohnella thermotolerans]
MLYRFARVLLLTLFRILYRFEARGVSNVPRSGPVVLCSNHLTNLDPITLGIAVPRKIHYMAKAELFRIPLFGSLIRSLGAFPVKRGGVSKEAIRTALGVLSEGKVMGIFPEGSRHAEKIDGVGMGKRGAVSMAARSGAAVVPVALVGNYRPFRKMVAVYGAPLDLSPYLVKGSEDWDGATDFMMTRIREMMRTGQPSR